MYERELNEKEGLTSRSLRCGNVVGVSPTREKLTILLGVGFFVGFVLFTLLLVLTYFVGFFC